MGPENRVRRRNDRLAASYDQRWRKYVAVTVRQTARRADVRTGERLLDVGCGTGELLRDTLGRSGASYLAGVDLSLAMLRVARDKVGARIWLVGADAACLPFASASFDIVVSSSALHEWPDPAACLREMARALAPGGRVVITDWCRDDFVRRLSDTVRRLFGRSTPRAYGSQECRVLLERAGFGNVRIERYRAGWAWGLMTATASLQHG
jgi:ubiquinone/menaquinone biosynthesis C-methylase UbiE